MEKWQRITTTPVFTTPYFAIRQDACRLPNGRIVPDYYVMEATDIVIVFAVTREKTVLLVEQYKHGWGDICLELPAGMSEGHDMLANAQRELLEETGYTSTQWVFLNNFIYSPTRCNNQVHLFLATDAVQMSTQRLDANEDIRVQAVPIDDILSFVKNNRVRVSDSVMSIYCALDYLKSNTP